MAQSPRSDGVGSTPRTRVRRLPEKTVRDRAVLHAVLDAGRVAHLAVSDEHGQPYVVPVAYARDGDRVLFHGSTGSRLFRALNAGAPTCLTVTLVHGLVAARSAFESSLHYRSVMVLGRAEQVRGPARLEALRVLTEHLLPGRWDELRAPHRRELAATMVLALPLDEASVKIGDGPPTDDPADVSARVWAGTVPLLEVLGTPVDAPDLPAGLPVPDYVAGWGK